MSHEQESCTNTEEAVLTLSEWTTTMRVRYVLEARQHAKRPNFYGITCGPACDGSDGDGSLESWLDVAIVNQGIGPRA